MPTYHNIIALYKHNVFVADLEFSLYFWYQWRRRGNDEFEGRQVILV